MNTNWTNKEEYLQFVSEWKCLYKALSSAIRTYKLHRRAFASLSGGGRKYLPLTLEEADHKATRAWSRIQAVKKIALAGVEAEAHFSYTPAAVATCLLNLRKQEKARAAEARKQAQALHPAL